jgi:hypothetical protein
MCEDLPGKFRDLDRASRSIRSLQVRAVKGAQRKIALKMHANVLAIRRKALSQVWVCLGQCGFPNETGGGEVPGWPSHMLGRGEIEDPWRKGLMGLRPLSVRTYDTPDSLAFRLYKSESAHGE